MLGSHDFTFISDFTTSSHNVAQFLNKKTKQNKTTVLILQVFATEKRFFSVIPVIRVTNKPVVPTAPGHLHRFRHTINYIKVLITNLIYLLLKVTFILPIKQMDCTFVVASI